MKVFTPADSKHRAGGLLIYSGLAGSVLSVLGILPFAPYWGSGAFAVTALLSCYGVYLKKRYCPRCRAGQCELKEFEER